MFEDIKDWEAERLGKFTASEIWKLLTTEKGKSSFGKIAKSYIKLKAAEILTCENNNGGRTNVAAMEWGNSHEQEAVQRFSKDLEMQVEYYGGGNPKFFQLNMFCGGSPDGITVDKAILEIKCPFNSAEHIEHSLLMTWEDLKEYAPEYYWQITLNMIVCKLEHAYFVSYDNRFMDDNLQLKVIHFELNLDDAKLLMDKITEAIQELNILVNKMRGLSI